MCTFLYYPYTVNGRSKLHYISWGQYRIANFTGIVCDRWESLYQTIRLHFLFAKQKEYFLLTRKLVTLENCSPFVCPQNIAIRCSSLGDKNKQQAKIWTDNMIHITMTKVCGQNKAWEKHNREHKRRTPSWLKTCKREMDGWSVGRLVGLIRELQDERPIYSKQQQTD